MNASRQSQKHLRTPLQGNRVGPVLRQDTRKCRTDFLPFSRPSITEAEIAGVGEVLRSGWITTGKKAAQFEERFKAYTGCSQAVALASATAGMHVVLKA